MTTVLPENWQEHCEPIEIDTADRVAWLNARREGFGGSDTYTLLGLKTYSTPADIVLSKLREYKRDSEGNDATYWGTTLETVVASEFERRSGMDVTELPRILRSKRYPWLLATIDRVVWEDGGWATILECKTGGYFRKDEWDGGIPDWVKAQVHHYMLVTGVRHAYVAALIGGQHFYNIRLEFDDALGNRILTVTRGAAETVNAVKAGSVGLDQVDEVMAKQVALIQPHRLVGVGVELGDTGLELVGEHMSALEEYRVAKRNLDGSQKALFDALGPGTIGLRDGREIYRREKKGRYFSVVLPEYDDLE